MRMRIFANCRVYNVERRNNAQKVWARSDFSLLDTIALTSSCTMELCIDHIPAR